MFRYLVGAEWEYVKQDKRDVILLSPNGNEWAFPVETFDQFFEEAKPAATISKEAYEYLEKWYTRYLENGEDPTASRWLNEIKSMIKPE